MAFWKRLFGSPSESTDLAKRRDESLLQIKTGYTQVVETMQAVRKHMEEQANRYERMIELFDGMPEVLRSIPKTNETNTQILQAVHCHIENQNQMIGQLNDTLRDLSDSTDGQQQNLKLIQQQLEASQQSDQQLLRSLGTLGDSMQQMNSVSAENVKAMTRVAEQARATDQEVKQLLEKSQQRFTLMFAASAVVSVLALAMAVFLVMSAGGAQNSQPVISEVSRGETSGGGASGGGIEAEVKKIGAEVSTAADSLARDESAGAKVVEQAVQESMAKLNQDAGDVRTFIAPPPPEVTAPEAPDAAKTETTPDTSNPDTSSPEAPGTGAVILYTPADAIIDKTTPEAPPEIAPPADTAPTEVKKVEDAGAATGANKTTPDTPGAADAPADVKNTAIQDAPPVTPDTAPAKDAASGDGGERAPAAPGS